MSDFFARFALHVLGDINISGKYHINGIPLSMNSLLESGVITNNLSVEGNIGIGSVAPTEKLDVIVVT